MSCNTCGAKDMFVVCFSLSTVITWFYMPEKASHISTFLFLALLHDDWGGGEYIRVCVYVSEEEVWA